MLPGTLEERRQLAIEVMDHVNFYQKIWEGARHASVIGKLIHTLTDYRVQEPMEIRKGTSAVAALKRNKELWSRLKFYLALPKYAQTTCKCKHEKNLHKNGKCTSPKRWWNNTGPKCECKCYVPVTL